MITNEFRDACAEINVILENMNNEEIEKVPIKLRNFFKKVSSQTNFYIDEKIPLEQQIKKKTKDILIVLYRNYWCQEKEKFDEMLRENEVNHQKKLREKYNPDDIFKRKQENNSIENINLPVEVKEEVVFYKIIRFIKGLFAKNK